MPKNEIHVIVTFPTADEPAKGNFEPDTQLKVVKQFALTSFGLVEGVVDGAQVTYFLYQGGSKLDLDIQLKNLIHGHEDTLALRLVKEIIAGMQ